MQYTLRGVPAYLDAALRERARTVGISPNKAAIDALAEGIRLTSSPRKRRDLGAIAGTWRASKGAEAALAAQDQVDAGSCLRR